MCVYRETTYMEKKQKSKTPEQLIAYKIELTDQTEQEFKIS